jgi:hypothetical protein
MLKFFDFEVLLYILRLHSMIKFLLSLKPVTSNLTADDIFETGQLVLQQVFLRLYTLHSL